MEQGIPDITPISVGDSLAEMIDPLRETLEKGEARVEELRNLTAQQIAANKQTRRALTVLDPTAVAKKKLKAKPGSNPSHNFSARKSQDFAKMIQKLAKKNGKGFVTQGELTEAMGAKTNQSKTSAAFRYLREIGYLGKNGIEPGTTRERYIILDEDAHSRALEMEEANA